MGESVAIDDEQLVIAVERHRNLYDTSAANYKDKTQKANSWISIATELNSDAETCSKCWKFLREKFGRIKKAKTLPSGYSCENLGRIHAKIFEEVVRIQSAHILN